MPVQMRRVMSSHVMEIGYDAETQQLHVRFAPSVKNPGGVSGYYADVDPITAESVETSPSIGSALNADIKGRYAWVEA